MHSMFILKETIKRLFVQTFLIRWFFVLFWKFFKVKLKSLPQDKQSLEELVGV